MVRVRVRVRFRVRIRVRDEFEIRVRVIGNAFNMFSVKRPFGQMYKIPSKHLCSLNDGLYIKMIANKNISC